MKVTLNSLGFAATLTVLALALVQCGSPAEGAEPDSEAGASRLTRVGVTTLNAEPFSHAFAVQGNVETDRIANILAEFPGVVQEVLVEEGAKVSQGQALLRINTDVLAKQRAEAGHGIFYQAGPADWNPKDLCVLGADECIVAAGAGANHIERWEQAST